MDAEALFVQGHFADAQIAFGRSPMPRLRKWTGIHGILLRFSVKTIVFVYGYKTRNIPLNSAAWFDEAS